MLVSLSVLVVGHTWNSHPLFILTSVFRFGPGPHEVEFRFKIDGTDRFFVVELAPVDEVPHAIHLFMEQVEHGLWNGCYFYLNGPHIVQVGPRLSEEGASEEHERARIAPFKTRGLDQLSFPDYSDDYPHVTWTLGYTGRPGGIDWYINKVRSQTSLIDEQRFHHNTHNPPLYWPTD